MLSHDRGVLLAKARSLLAAGRLAEAEQMCIQLLSRNHSDVDALSLKCAVSFQHGSLEVAETLSARCVSLQPRNASFLFQLGKVRAALGRYCDAIVQFEKALEVDSTMSKALVAKAESLNFLGQTENAAKLLHPLMAAGHESADAALLYATLSQQAGRHEDAAALATRHLANPALDGPVRVRLGLLAGRSFEQLDDIDRSFDAYRQANSTRATYSRFDREKCIAAVDALIAFFTPQRVSSLHRSTIDSELPVFIAGMPRSGTTLVEQIIDAHPSGYGAGEATVLERLIASLPEKTGTREPVPKCLASLSTEVADNIGSDYLAEIGRSATGATRIVNKYLRNHQHLGIIWMLLPRARVIHCRRNPIENCFSCYTSALSPLMHAWCSDFANLGLYYRQYVRVMAHWRAVLDVPILDVQYEELVTNPETMTRRIIEFCDLPWDDRCLRFHESGRTVRTLSFDQVRRPMYTKSLERSAPYYEHLGPLREALEDADHG